VLQESLLFLNKEILFSALDLFPVKYQAGETANSQQGGAGSSKGKEKTSSECNSFQVQSHQYLE
jgi:hypothetical protein